MFSSGKTTMTGPSGVKSTVCLAVLTQFRHVSFRQTDRRTDGRTQYTPNCYNSIALCTLLRASDFIAQTIKTHNKTFA